MNNIKIILSLIVVACFALSGCSGNVDNGKSTNDLDLKSKTTNKDLSTADTKEEKEIILTLNNVKFNLNKPFENTLLNTLNTEELSILRNSIYAKYGYNFSTKEMSVYFSQFSWYAPISKDIEEKLNSVDKENIKNITILEKSDGLVFKNSKDYENYGYDKNGNIILDFDNKKVTLYLSWEDLNTSETSNNPTKLTLSVSNVKVVFESLWNDGVYVSTADFDKTDKDIDIYITETGTDIQSTTYIYKFDGAKIYQHAKFEHYFKDFLYDEKGNIYYRSNENDDINMCFNYKTKQSSNITDNNLKTKLDMSK
jgi:hypothetical protein